jgi:hypothetical protein
MRAMTRDEWGSCTEVPLMLTFLRDIGRLTERKARLFGAACCRRLWQLLPDERARKAVEVTEQYVEGTASAKDRDRAREAARLAEGVWDHVFRGACTQAVCAVAAARRASWKPALEAAEAAARAVGHDAAWPTYRGGQVDYDHEAARAARRTEAAVQCGLLRDLFGDPFRPLPTLDNSLLEASGSMILCLAQTAYEERLPQGTLDPARLSILADALEEAGAPPEILHHLREPGPHVRGCVGLDVVLGKS